MTTVNGLPAHLLLVHAVVVLVPLTSVLLVLIAAWPAARRRLVVPTAVLSVVTLISVPFTTEAGEWLEHRLPRTELLHTHTELGDTMLPWTIGLTVVALAFLARDVLEQRGQPRVEMDRGGPGTAVATHARRDRGAPGGVAVTVVMAVLAVIVAVGSVITVYQIGDSGARAAWTGQYSPTPLPRPAGQPAPPSDDN